MSGFAPSDPWWREGFPTALFILLTAERW